MFFDFARDILWLGNGLHDFFMRTRGKDRDALRNIAIDSSVIYLGLYEFSRKGQTMALKIHTYLLFLEHFVYSNFRVSHNSNGPSIPLSLDLKATLVQLKERTDILSYPEVEHGDQGMDDYWDHFRSVYKHTGWACPEARFMDCIAYERGTEILKGWDEQQLDKSWIRPPATLFTWSC